MTLMTALSTTIGIWFSSSLFSLPNFIFSVTSSEPLPNGDVRIICMIKWPDAIFDYYYNLAVLILTYFLPITLMTLTYFRVATVLWGSKTIGENCSAKQAQSIKSKRKIVKMMVLVLISFAILWLPYHCYFLATHHFPEITSVKFAQHIYLALYFLAMSTSMLNPPIYCWLNSRFRRGFRKALFCEYCKTDSNLDQTDTRKSYLRACQMGYLKKQWPSSSEPQSTTESTAQKFKCSSSASSNYYSSHSGFSGQAREVPYGQVLTVYPHTNIFTNSPTRIINTSGNKSNSLFNIQNQHHLHHQTDTTSLTNRSEQLMVLNDRSSIKVCISSDSNHELNNNNIIVHLKELERNQDRLDADETNKEPNKKDESKTKDVDDGQVLHKQFKNIQIKQKKFAIAAKQLNKPLSASQSYSSVCLKNGNFDSIEMLEPSSSCSSVYSTKKNSQVDQV